jgi:metallo-beta-lactamase family protein
VNLSFLGAAGEVTGSCTVVETPSVRFVVDCGLFQGGREADAKNRSPFRFRPADLDFVIFTHAHLDHCGLLPRLLAEGFGGRIWCTPATADLAPIMLADSAHIMEKEAERATARGREPGPPLYRVADAERVPSFLEPSRYGRDFVPHRGVRARFQDAGHILGSAITELWIDDEGRQIKLVFSGDLGQPERPVVRDPRSIDVADLLVVESTYGNRDHKGMGETLDELAACITETVHRRHGKVVVPAFALGRTQDVIVILAQLAREGRIAATDVYVDSPLAAKATEVFLRHQASLDAEFQALLRASERGAIPLRVRFTQSPEESKALNTLRGGAVIIASSGMCDGGRVRHHLRHNLPRPESAVLFTGFQAQGTLGRRIVDRASPVKLFGEEVPVRARIHTVGGLSAHADRTALLAWLARFQRPPRRVFVNHGEADTARGFADAVSQRFGWNVTPTAPGLAVDV